MLIIFLRVIILYILVVIVIRMMGKRQIGELQPFELVITIMIAELAASPMENTGIPLVNGIIPIITLLFLESLFSVLVLKSEKARKLIDGTPSIIMDKGEISYRELKRQRININDLLEHLRTEGYYNLHELEYVIIEPDGKLSIIPKAENRPITPKDMNIKPEYEGLSITLIIDGIRNNRNMKMAKCTDKWLNAQLKNQSVKEDDEILLAYVDANKNLYIHRKDNKDRSR